MTSGETIRWWSVLATACLAVGACASLTDPGEPTPFGPNVERVRTLLDQDRVREALERARDLEELSPGLLTDVLVGRALWRNGDLGAAERRFRRAARAGIPAAQTGLAAVAASIGDWGRADSLAALAVVDDEAAAAAYAISSSSAWQRGDPEAARTELMAWSRVEAEVWRTAVAAAMARAVGSLAGPAMRWEGEVSAIDLERVPAGGYVVEVRLGDRPARFLLDLTARQSLVSEEVAAAAGLFVEASTVGAVARSGPAGMLAGLVPRQAACELLRIGDVLLHNLVLGVQDLADGVDGILAMDLLAGSRWTLLPESATLVIAPPDKAREVDLLVADPDRTVIGWLRGRFVYQGLAAQFFVMPRVGGELTATALDLSGPSLIEPRASGDRVGRVTAFLRLGGWSSEVEWNIASLEGWAVDGGVAPRAVLGADFLGAWVIHWLPELGQLRLEAPGS